MDIVEQIAKSVLPKVLSNAESQTKEAGLVSQFIAIFATKIAGTEGLSLNANDTGASIIQSVFTQAEERGELITKLSELHDVDETTTQGLLAKSAPLVTGELNTLAGGSSLQGYLKDHLSLLGAKLPTWATNILPSSILGALGTLGAGAAAVGAGAAALGGKAGDLAGDAVGAVGNVAGGAVDAVGNVAGGAVDAVGAVAGKAGDLAGDAVDAVGNVAGKAGDLAGDAVDAVGNVAGGAVDAVGDVAGKVGDLGAGAAAGVAGAAGATAAAGGSLMKKLFPLLGLIGLGILGLILWKSCAGKPEAPVVNTEPTEKTAPAVATDNALLDDAVVNLATGQGDTIYACNGYVGSQGLKDKIMSAVKNVFGSDEKCAIRVDDSYKSAIANEDKIQEAFEAAKAIPDASLRFNGDQISVNAADPAARASLVEQLKGILPGFTIAEESDIDVDSVVETGIAASLAALEKLDNKSSGRKIAKALNLQVINFATGKFEIPEKNKVVLDKAATLLKGNNDAKLAIIGHTDSTGDETANVTLSNNRALAVKDYMIAKGAAAESLVATGRGSADPADTNATANGRFHNRRISFDSDATVFGDIFDSIAGAGSAVAGGVADAAGAVVDGAADAASTTAEVASDVVKGTAEVAGDVVEGTVDVAGDVVEGTANAAGAVAAGAANAVGTVAEGTADAAQAVADKANETAEVLVE